VFCASLKPVGFTELWDVHSRVSCEGSWAIPPVFLCCDFVFLMLVLGSQSLNSIL